MTWTGFTGVLCEQNIDECDQGPCHYGVCKDGIATFSCECNPGYTGSICNIQVEECHSNPCQNGARCIDLVDAYQCNCPQGTSGKLTQQKHLLNVFFYSGMDPYLWRIKFICTYKECDFDSI